MRPLCLKIGFMKKRGFMSTLARTSLQRLWFAILHFMSLTNRPYCVLQMAVCSSCLPTQVPCNQAGASSTLPIGPEFDGTNTRAPYSPSPIIHNSIAMCTTVSAAFWSLRANKVGRRRNPNAASPDDRTSHRKMPKLPCRDLQQPQAATMHTMVAVIQSTAQMPATESTPVPAMSPSLVNEPIGKTVTTVPIVLPSSKTKQARNIVR